MLMVAEIKTHLPVALIRT